MNVKDMLKNVDGIQLTDEELEALSGGEWDGDDVELTQTEAYLNVMRIFKERGWTKELFVQQYSYLGKPGEIATLADQYWDTL